MSRIYDLILESLEDDNNDNEVNFQTIIDKLTNDHYFNILQHNIISELVCSLKKVHDKHKIKLYGKILKDGIVKTESRHSNFTNNVVTINNSYYFITSAEYDPIEGYTFLKLYPKIEFTSTSELTEFFCIKYIGNSLHQLSSLFHIKSNYSNYVGIISSFLNSNKYVKGEYEETKDTIKLSKMCNNSQFDAISNLINNIELIHGPPGTGKSTTIVNIINCKVPKEHNILCTAIQNQAVESIVTKLINVSENFVVIGDDDRLKEISKRYSLNKYYNDNYEIRNINTQIYNIKKDIENVSKYTLDDKPENKNKLNALKKTYNITGSRLSNLYDGIYAHIKQKELEIEQIKKNIINSFRIFICTIDTSYKFYGLVSNKQISTIILDEAGSTKETDMLPLIRLNPKNIIMIGDPKQLSAFCDLQLDSIQKNILTQSPLERLILNGRKHSILTLQYRMNSDICKIVSKLFYNDQLQSIKSKIIEGNKSIKWINVFEKEQFDSKLDSYFNPNEVEEVIKICNMHCGQEIMILTSYNAQLQYLNNMLGNSPDPSLIARTIDSSQGSESDIVIISLTRSNNENNIGFLNDNKRMCVALSRAKQLLYIVGNKSNFENCKNKNWRAVAKLLK